MNNNSCYIKRISIDYQPRPQIIICMKEYDDQAHQVELHFTTELAWREFADIITSASNEINWPGEDDTDD